MKFAVSILWIAGVPNPVALVSMMAGRRAR